MSVTNRGVPALLVLLLAGCGPGRDPVGTPVSWWHNLQGGVIAQQRPPPPGVDAPYPLVGTTPARPVISSAAARDALTASLIDQQSASHQLDARNPIIVTAPPPRSKPATPPADQTTGAAPPSSATLDAAGTTPTNPATAPAPATAPTPQDADEPILAMPPPPPGTTVVVTSGPLPQMAARPPAPPNFPGFDIPATTVPPIEPELAGRASALPNIAFQPGSDVLMAAAQPTLHRIASARGAASVRIDAGGDARSDLPDAQAAALRLALARAASASHALEALGVPAASIEVAANAFGRGATVAVVH